MTFQKLNIKHWFAQKKRNKMKKRSNEKKRINLWQEIWLATFFPTFNSDKNDGNNFVWYLLPLRETRSWGGRQVYLLMSENNIGGGRSQENKIWNDAVGYLSMLALAGKGFPSVCMSHQFNQNNHLIELEKYPSCSLDL